MGRIVGHGRDGWAVYRTDDGREVELPNELLGIVTPDKFIPDADGRNYKPATLAESHVLPSRPRPAKHEMIMGPEGMIPPPQLPGHARESVPDFQLIEDRPEPEREHPASFFAAHGLFK